MSGKGSFPRPLSIPREDFGNAFDIIFRSKSTFSIDPVEFKSYIEENDIQVVWKDQAEKIIAVQEVLSDLYS